MNICDFLSGHTTISVNDIPFILTELCYFACRIISMKILLKFYSPLVSLNEQYGLDARKLLL